MIEFVFTDAIMELPRIRDNFDLLVGVSATLTIRVGDRVLFEEADLPIVELRVQLAQWLAKLASGNDFELDSLESDDTGIVWIRKVSSGKWQIGSVWQEYAEKREWTEVEVRACIEGFASRVDAWALAELKVDLVERFGLA